MKGAYNCAMRKQDHAAAATAAAPSTGGDPQDFDICLKLIEQLWALRQAMLEREKALEAELDKVLPEYRQSARNLIHYLTLRSIDLRPLQEQLARLGLSSLGRSESHVLASLDKVLGLLHRLTGQAWQDKSAEEPAGSISSRALLKKHTLRLLGQAPAGRPVRIMVTLPSDAASVGVWEVWLARLKAGSHIHFTDARGAKRQLLVVHNDDTGAVTECLQTAYLTPETVLTLGGAGGKKKHAPLVCQIDSQQGALRLHVGDHLRLTRDGLGQPAAMDDDSDAPSPEPAHLAVTLPQVIDQARVGQRICFDDGRIGGVIRQQTDDWLDIEITQARPEGEKLTGDKGINLPDSKLNLPALSDKDIEDLQTVAAEADMVGLSFVQKPADIALLRGQLQRLGRDDMGIVLKIETLQGFENLPELMLSAMASNVSGVMIARGDLAVECGYERLAEVQEEILWCAEAAHMPVIWATQVLEFMAKTGLPSRAEISDAGLGVGAECVMLNKGPYIGQAIRTLDDILKRMGGSPGQKTTAAARAESLGWRWHAGFWCYAGDSDDMNF